MAAQPAAEESLDFADLLQVVELHVAARSHGALGAAVATLPDVSLAGSGASGRADTAVAGSQAAGASGGARS